jgi:hypothetical protein
MSLIGYAFAYVWGATCGAVAAVVAVSLCRSADDCDTFVDDEDVWREGYAAGVATAARLAAHPAGAGLRVPGDEVNN